MVVENDEYIYIYRLRSMVAQQLSLQLKIEVAPHEFLGASHKWFWSLGSQESNDSMVCKIIISNKKN